MNKLFSILFLSFFFVNIYAQDCVNLNVTEHMSGDPICWLKEGDKVEICINSKTIQANNCYYHILSKKMNIKSNIVMPEGTPFTKIRRTKNFGGNVIIKGSNLDASYKHVQSLIEDKGFIEVHPYNDINVISGQGTISYEMISDCNEIDTLLIPVGGGGLIA